jgi:RNase P/RNase MRP subunit POP5
LAKRYVLVKIVSKSTLPQERFESALTESVRKCFGEFGLARIGPKVIRFDSARSEGVVACNKESVEDLQAAIGLIADQPEGTVTAITMRVSGTLKGLRRQHF